MSLKYSNTGRLPKIFGRFIIIINSCNPDFFNFVFLFMRHYSKQPRAFREELRMIFHGYTRSIHFVCKA